MIIVDTGPLVAVADADDRHHDACTALFRDVDSDLVVPMLVVVEVSYLLARNLGVTAESAFLRSFERGELIAEHVHPVDWARMADLTERYADLPLGTVDASVIAAAERLGTTRVATLDRRHFSVVRPSHIDAFELLP